MSFDMQVICAIFQGEVITEGFGKLATFLGYSSAPVKVSSEIVWVILTGPDKRGKPIGRSPLPTENNINALCMISLPP
jgi:hypothetical protein